MNYSKDYDVETEIILPKTQLIVGTEAMNTGVSSNSIKYCMYHGIPSNLYDFYATDRLC